MDELDTIPWKKLTHAYGSADDVPELLRELKTMSPKSQGEDSPLWQLFGNIWHQGTVYEATSYAVPFLIELAANQNTPARIGILELLGVIAKRPANSIVQKEPNWDAKAHASVAAGFETLVKIANEGGEIGLTASYVLAQFPDYVNAVGFLFRRLLAKEADSHRRSGYLLLIGQLGDRSTETLSLLTIAASNENVNQRIAAAVSFARLQPKPLPFEAREALIEALTGKALDEVFQQLPWVDYSDCDPNKLFDCLDTLGREEVVVSLIEAIENDRASTAQVSTLVNVLFPSSKSRKTPKITARDLSSLQVRAVRAMVGVMENGKRIFLGHFPCWGLPDSMLEWRDLVAGRQPTEIDLSLPLLADPENPNKPLHADQLVRNRKILHRHFGVGVVLKTENEGTRTRIYIRFEEEGNMTFFLPTDDGRESSA